MDINLSPIDASSTYTALKRKLPTSIFLKFGEKQDLIEELREPTVDLNSSEESNSESLPEARAAPARKLITLMKFLDGFTSNSEESAVFLIKRGRGQSKQQVPRLILKQTNILLAITHSTSSHFKHNLLQKKSLTDQEEKKIILVYFA